MAGPSKRLTRGIGPGPATLRDPAPPQGVARIAPGAGLTGAAPGLACAVIAVHAAPIPVRWRRRAAP